MKLTSKEETTVLPEDNYIKITYEVDLTSMKEVTLLYLKYGVPSIGATSWYCIKTHNDPEEYTYFKFTKIGVIKDTIIITIEDFIRVYV